MLTERETIKGEAIFNEERTHRFLLKRTWNKAKPLAAVVMLNPCDADALLADTTTYLVINNVARLEEFGGVIIVNLYSRLTSKLNFKWNDDTDLNLPENDVYIKKAAEEASKVILAWGRAVDTHKRVAERSVQVLNQLLEYREKLYVISDGERIGLHPLTPAIRNRWVLETFDSALEKRKLQEQEKARVAEMAKKARAITVVGNVNDMNGLQADENIPEEEICPVEESLPSIEEVGDENVVIVGQGSQR